VIKKSTSWI